MTPGVVHEFKTSAAGTVVMETMNPGTGHEMINMYHVDGDDLLLTHYCAGNNQPRMRLNREAIDTRLSRNSGEQGERDDCNRS